MRGGQEPQCGVCPPETAAGDDQGGLRQQLTPPSGSSAWSRLSLWRLSIPQPAICVRRPPEEVEKHKNIEQREDNGGPAGGPLMRGGPANGTECMEAPLCGPACGSQCTYGCTETTIDAYRGTVSRFRDVALLSILSRDLPRARSRRTWVSRRRPRCLFVDVHKKSDCLVSRHSSSHLVVSLLILHP